MLEGSHKGVKGCFTGISRVLHQSYKNVTRVFHWCLNEVTRVLLGHHKGVYGVSQICYRVFQWSDMQECHIRCE